MTAPETVVGIERVQPVIFAMQVALASTARSYGVQPGAVIGHSLGEAAAAVVAGVLSLEDGVRVICRRSWLCARLAGGGAMGSVELPVAQVQAELAAAGITDVVVSVVASPQSTVVGGAPQTVRDLIAGWESREIMAREVAVDVASHSPHVDPILVELAEVLADLAPRTPTVPFYSATLDDPRALPSCDAQYWVDNLRSPVQFAGAVQAALDDGFRVFGELSPHPLLMRGVEQTAKAGDVAVQAIPAMRRQLEQPHGLRDFVADLYCAGAAVDFSVLYPQGRLLDAPLPTWTHDHQLLIGSGDRDAAQQGATTVAVHPLLGEHVRLPEEPERHAWQGDVGTAKLPWLADHKVNNVAAYPGAAYCEMALAATYTLFGATDSGGVVTDIQFEQLMLLDDRTEVTAVATVEGTGVAEFAVETDQDGERIRQAVATLRTADDQCRPTSHDIAGLLSAHPNRISGEEIRQWFATRRIQFGPAFSALTAVHSADGDGSTLFAEVGLAGDIRSQQSAYGIHPALLDACFQSVAAGLRAAGGTDGGLLLPLSVTRLRRFGPGRDARYCLARIVSSDGTAVEADLDIVDAQGQVVVQVAGLRMGSRSSKSSDRERILSERLLTVEWDETAAPKAADGADAGAWLLVAPDDRDAFATRLAEAMTTRGADCRIATGDVSVDELTRAGLRGVVLVTAPADDEPGEQSLSRGREVVESLVHIARELPDAEGGEPPRLYVLTRGAQVLTAGDRVNLDQGGVRGLLRVIGAEHPPLRPTQIDIDAHTVPDGVAEELLSGSPEDETAWRNGSWFIARLQQSPLRPDERRTTTVDTERDGMRLDIRTPGDLESLEFVTTDRQPPEAGQIEVAVDASSINFADVLLAFGRYFSVDGQRPGLGVDFAGVVTGVGPGVTGHKVGDRVGAIADAVAWGTFVTCDAQLAATLPDGMTAEVAAAVSTAYATAWCGLHDMARIGRRSRTDPFRDRRCRAGGDRDRPSRRGRDLRHRGQPRQRENCCAHGHRARIRLADNRFRRARSAATPTATASTWCSTR